jgi:hypothetical protein
MSQSAIKRRDGLHGFSRSRLALNPRLVAAKKRLRIAAIVFRNLLSEL